MSKQQQLRKQLQSEAKRRGLLATGTTEQLQQRLDDHRKQEEIKTKPPSNELHETDELDRRVDGWKLSLSGETDYFFHSLQSVITELNERLSHDEQRKLVQIMNNYIDNGSLLEYSTKIGKMSFEVRSFLYSD